MEKRNVSKYGWHKDLPDFRDHLFNSQLTTLPSKVDLTPLCPPVYDQGQLGSCTANAIGAAVEFGILKEKLIDFMPSRLFIYYNERLIEGTVRSDSGAAIRDGIKTVNKQGVCPEPEWAYNIAKFKTKPSVKCYKDALRNVVTSYLSVAQDLTAMKQCLADGYPIVIGFSVYTSFESQEVANTGIVNLPVNGEKLLGGHAVLVVGYDDATQRFTVRNSWGNDWGNNGYFTMPYEYLTNPKLASDFWTLRTVL